MSLPRLPEPMALDQLRANHNLLVDELDKVTLRVFNDESDFNAQVTSPGDFMLVGLRNKGTFNIYLNGKLNQVWPALPAFEYGTEAPTHVAPNGTIFIQTGS